MAAHGQRMTEHISMIDFLKNFEKHLDTQCINELAVG